MTILDHLVAEADERAAKYRQYREYYDGEHETQINSRQQAYLILKAGQEFSANYMQIVVDSLATRLRVKGFTGSQSDVLDDWFTRSHMAAHQADVHTSAIRDGDAFIMCAWDDENGRATMTPHMAYDGRSGAQIHYDFTTGEPLAASRYWWIEFGEQAGKIRRMDLYYPDRILRYFTKESSITDWRPYTGDGQPSTIPWVDPVTRRPIGIPIIHFANRARGFSHGFSEIEPGIPMQNALNKSVIDLIAAADTSAFRLIWGSGEDFSGVTVSPGAFIFSEKSKQETDMKVFPGEDLRPMIEVVDSFVQRIGQVTDTPLSYFQLSGQMASEGTHKAHEGRMLAKARQSSGEMGVGWGEVGKVCLSMSNAFGGSNYDLDQVIDVEWEDFDTRDINTRLLEQAEIIKTLTDAGVGIKQAAIRAGLNEDDATALAEFDVPADAQRLMDQLTKRSGDQNDTATSTARE